MTDAVPARWADLLTPEHAIPTTTLCLGVSLFAFNAFLISTALPTAIIELGGTFLIAWALTIYLVFAIVGGAAAAFAKQRLGGRNALVAAATIFLAGTGLAAAATSMPQIIVGRAFQGLGEGIVAAICYALIPELFPSRLVQKVFGAEAMVWAAAAFGGPLAAGVLTELISWRVAFLVNVPLGLLFIALVFAVVPNARNREASSGIPGMRLGAIGAGILLVCWAGIVESRLFAGLMLLGATALLAGAVRLDRSAAVRLLPQTAFSPSTLVGAGLWVVFLMPMAQASTTVYLVLALQELWQLTPTVAGAIGALMAVAWSLSAIAIASLQTAAARLGLLRIGSGLLVFGLLAVMIALQDGSLPLLLLGQIMTGAAFGVTWGPLSQILMEACEDSERDRTSALLPTLQSAGYAIGAALFGLAANISGLESAAPAASLRPAMLVVFALAVVLAVAAFAASRRVVTLGRRDVGQGADIAPVP